MGILNRTLDISEQKKVVNATVFVQGVTATATPIWYAPYPCVVHAAKIVGLGVSGTPVAHIKQERFVVGAGLTSIGIVGTLGASVPIKEWSLSGPQACTLGITLLEAGDMLSLDVAAQANTAVRNVNIEIVVQGLQDIKTYYGV